MSLSGNWYNPSLLFSQEQAGGSINGENTIFTVAHPVFPNSLMLFLTGVYQVPGIDYNLSGQTITMAVAPVTGSRLSARYLY